MKSFHELAAEVAMEKLKSNLAKEAKKAPCRAEDIAEEHGCSCNDGGECKCDTDADCCDCNATNEANEDVKVKSADKKPELVNVDGKLVTRMVPTTRRQADKKDDVEEGKKPGLWANMHARRKAGKPKLKPGDKNYPKTLDIESKEESANLKLINRIKNSGVVKTGSMSKDAPVKKEATEESMQLTKNSITKSGNANVMKSFNISKLKNDLVALRKNLKRPNPGSPKRGLAYEAKTEIKKGDTVRLKKKYADGPAEAKMDYIVKELRGPRVLIAPKVWKSGGIVPTESVQMYMIEKPAMAEATTEITQIIGLTEMTETSTQRSLASLRREDVEQIDELTAAEKKLVNQMYDKKGNLTPLGKRVMDHGKKTNEGVKTFAEISKGMAGRYIKKAQVSTADAAKSTERGYADSRSPDRDIAKAGSNQAKKGVKTFINRNKGTSTAVNKLTGKAKVPAK
tara:strand:+ start:25789 stop:27153 length:1365 start_codon:yes stop_codon:yes gene_type:complete